MISSSRIFKHHVSILPEDIDDLGHVNNVVYLRWVQEVASAHWYSVATEEMRENYLWVVLRHEIDYRTPAFIEDEVTGSTWVGEHHGARFDRFVKLGSPSGKLFAEAKTNWCLIDAKSMKPVRIPKIILQLL